MFKSRWETSISTMSLKKISIKKIKLLQQQSMKCPFVDDEELVNDNKQTR